MSTLLLPGPSCSKGGLSLSSGLITIQRIAQLVFVIPILWIAIYPVDNVIQLLNNRDLVGRKYACI